MTDLPRIPDAHTETEDWLEWKRGRLGGNDAATLLGCNEYQTIHQLYDRVVHGVVQDRSVEDRDFLSWRLSLEANIADRYANDTGRKLRRVKSAYHPENPRIIESPDREIVTDPKGPGVLEIKSRDPLKWNTIKTAGAPAATFAQLQHYLGCKPSRTFGAICEANVSSGKQITADIEPDREFHRMLFQRMIDFLDACDRRERPEMEKADPVRMPAVAGELVTVEQLDAALVGEFKEMTEAWQVAKGIAADAKDYLDRVTEIVQQWMLRHEIDVVEGFGLRIYYKEQAGRRTFDKKALAAAHPEIDLSEFEKQGKPFRAFRTYTRPLRIE